MREARWESWRRMAAQLPDHHILAVELFRVERNVTVAIYTLVKNGEVVQQVLRGDGRGLNVRPIVPREEHCIPLDLGRSLHVEALLLRDTLTGTDDGPRPTPSRSESRCPSSRPIRGSWPSEEPACRTRSTPARW